MAQAQMISGTQQVANSQPASSTSGSEFDFSSLLDNLDMGFDEDGQLSFTQKPETSSNLNQETVVDETISDLSAAESNRQDVPQVSPDDRIANLESSINALTGQFQQVLTALQNNQSQRPQEQQETETELDFSDSQTLQRWIAKTIQDTVQKAVAPYQQTNEMVQLRLDYHDAAAKFGDDFVNKLPAIAEIVKVDPSNISFEKAYQIVNAALTKVPVKSDGNFTQQQVVKKPAQQLVQKAQQLETQTGQAVVSNGKVSKFGSVKDAYQAAFEELFGQG